MKTTFLTMLALVALLQSCSQNKASVGSGGYEKEIVLGAFNDATSAPSLDLSELSDLPKSVNLRDEMTPVKNQSDRGTCTFFATMSLVEGTIKQELGKEVNLSEEYLNYKTKSMGAFSRSEGSSINSNINALKAGGLLLERDWSYQPTWFQPGLPCANYENTDSSAPALCYSHSLPDKETLTKLIPSNGIKFGSIYKDTNEIIKFIAKYKRPLTIDVNVNFNGWPQSGDVFYNEDLRQECLQTPSDCGGHSVLLTGYDLERKVFFFKNSWGKEWGDQGFGTMTFKMVDEYVNSSLFYAHIPDPDAFILPEDYDKDYLNISDIDFVSVYNEENKTLGVKVQANLENIRGRTIYTSSFIMAKSKDVEEAADNNTSILQLNATEAAAIKSPYLKTLNFLLSDSDLVSWSEEAPLLLDFHNEALSLDTFQEAMNSDEKDVLVRSTIYLHTDDQTYKTIKRVYHPIAL